MSKEKKKEVVKKEPKVARPRKLTLKEQLKQSEDKFLRKVAELENFRKRSIRDVQEARVFAKSQTIEEFLAIYDTFKMALQSSNDANANLDVLIAGLNMIANEFSKSFTNLGVEEINVSKGMEFDPNIHEAVAKQVSKEVASGLIIGQQRCGYKLGEKLIRPATCIISEQVSQQKDEESK